MKPYIMTCDAGTTGVKCAAFARDGEALFERTEEYPTLYPAPGWAQQDPDAVLGAAVKGIRSALEILPASGCEALVFTGTMNGCIPLDEKGDALGPNLIHSDLRAAGQTDRILSLIPLREYYLRTGVRADVHSGLPKYMWLKDNAPDIYRRARTFVNIKDYLYLHMSFTLTRRHNLVAVVTDGTAVLGLGDIGPEAGMPVMEGKCALFKAFGDVDAFPICVRSKDVDEIVRTVYLISGSFGGINLEDIAAPRCFEIERKLKEICDIPVFHDDQHGTAVVVGAALLRSAI